MSRSVRRPLLIVAIVAAMLGVMAIPVNAAPPAENTRVSGVGYPAAPGGAACPDDASADYAIELTGDLVGCIYGHITEDRLHPSGTYQERADEVFVGAYDGKTGSFMLVEHFTAKFTDAGQVFGRCQHPMITNSGTGDFENGISGRLDFKDDVAAGNAAYKGHLKVSP